MPLLELRLWRPAFPFWKTDSLDTFSRNALWDFPIRTEQFVLTAAMSAEVRFEVRVKCGFKTTEVSDGKNLGNLEADFLTCKQSIRNFESNFSRAHA